MKKYLLILIICLQALLFCQEPATIKRFDDSVNVKSETDIIRLKAESKLISKGNFKIIEENKLRPVETTILLESIVSPLMGVGAAYLGMIIGLTTASGQRQSSKDIAMSAGAAIGYTLGIGTGGYLIAKGGYPKSSFWLSSLASIAGGVSGIALFSVFDKERGAVYIPLLTPIIFTILFNHIYGTY